ncbi:MAG TPA: T9SS type A sorting domain-containing protein [Chitinophagales bacterium]|nr:T9SS type A sorting domain-containing protein [Chitinophagales bacterium]
MKTFFSLTFALLITSFFTSTLFAGSMYYWKPSGSSRSFNSTGNWKVGSCSGSSAAHVPTTGDSVSFSSCSNKECHIDVNVTVDYITIVSGYTDTLYQDNGYTLTFVTGSFKGGVFIGNNSAISCTNSVTIDGTAFKSTSDVLTITGDFTYKTGGFTHNYGKVVFNKGTGSSTVIKSTSNSIAVSFYNVEFGAPSHNTSFNVRDIDMQVNNELELSGDSSILLSSTTSSIIQAKGDVVSSNKCTTGGGTATIEINGSSSQTWSDTYGTDESGKFPNIKINKSGGSTLSLSGSIAIGGSAELNYVAGTLSSGTSNVILYYNNTIRNNSSGAMSLYNLEIMGNGGRDSVKGTITVTHNFTTSQSGNCNIVSTNGGNGTIEVLGNLTWNNTATSQFGNVSFKCAGSGSQTFNGSIEPTFHNLEINKSGGSLTLSYPLSIANNLKLVSKNIITTSTNLLTLKNGCTVSNVSYSSFVSGPVKKIGNSAFTFPVGKSTSYNPIKITAPSSSSDAFTAEFFNSAHATTTKDTSLTYLSTCEYWTLTRNTGSSNVKISLTWNQNTCDIYALSTLRLGYLNSGTWQKVAASTEAGSTRITGTITTNSTVSSFGSFTIGRKVGTDTLAYLTEISKSIADDYRILAKSLVNLTTNDTFIHVFVDEANQKPVAVPAVTLKSLATLCTGNSFNLSTHMQTNLISNRGTSYDLYRLAQIKDSLLYDNFIFYPKIIMSVLDSSFFDQDDWDHYSTCALTTPQFYPKDSVPIYWMSGITEIEKLVRTKDIINTATWTIDNQNLITMPNDDYESIALYGGDPCMCVHGTGDHYDCLPGCPNSDAFLCGYSDKNDDCTECCFCSIVLHNVNSECSFLDSTYNYSERLTTNANNSKDITLYPSPCNAAFNILFSVTIKNVEVKVTDTNGRVIKSEGAQNINTMQFDTRNLLDGIYYVIITESEKQITRKIVIIH